MVGTAVAGNHSAAQGRGRCGCSDAAPDRMVLNSHHRPHVVVYSTSRETPSKTEKRALAAAERCHQPLVVDELDVTRQAPAEGGDKHREPVAPAPDGREIGLHLAPWIGLEPNHRLTLGIWSERRELILQGTVGDWIAERFRDVSGQTVHTRPRPITLDSSAAASRGRKITIPIDMDQITCSEAADLLAQANDVIDVPLLRAMVYFSPLIA